jgi:hypothetical protein
VFVFKICSNLNFVPNLKFVPNSKFVPFSKLVPFLKKIPISNLFHFLNLFKIHILLFEICSILIFVRIKNLFNFSICSDVVFESNFF